MTHKPKLPKVTAEFHTADGIRSVLHKNWPFPAPVVWRRGVYPETMGFEFSEIDVPAYTPDFREYHIERVETNKQGNKKVVYRERRKAK